MNNQESIHNPSEQTHKIIIEKNIPIPISKKGRGLRSPELEKLLDTLEVGDSFVIIGAEEKGKVINRIKHKKISYACRCIEKPVWNDVSTFKYRIWKKAKNL